MSVSGTRLVRFFSNNHFEEIESAQLPVGRVAAIGTWLMSAQPQSQSPRYSKSLTVLQAQRVGSQQYVRHSHRDTVWRRDVGALRLFFTVNLLQLYVLQGRKLTIRPWRCYANESAIYWLYLFTRFSHRQTRNDNLVVAPNAAHAFCIPSLHKMTSPLHLIRHSFSSAQKGLKSTIKAANLATNNHFERNVSVEYFDTNFSHRL